MLSHEAAAVANATLAWHRTQTLRREDGQASYNFSDAISSLGNLVAIGSTSANRGRGEVTILRDKGGGLEQIAVIKNPTAGPIGEQFGQSLLLFNYIGFTQVAVAAVEAQSGVGCVYLFQQRVDNETLWDYIQRLDPPTGTYVIHFGRNLIYDGTQLIISAERVYKSGPRFRVTAINIVGTSKYIQSDGVENTIGGDPMLVFRSVQDRNSKTYLAFYKTISDTDFTTDTGASISVSGDLMAVGASFREPLKYGSGTDGDLDIRDVKLLDGAASYNFNSIIIRSGGVLTVDHYETIRNMGGVMTVKVKTLLYIEKGGLINLTAAGYKGGRTAFTGSASPQDGQFLGGGGRATSKNVGVYACDYSSTVSVGVQLSETLASVSSLAINQSLPFAEACGGGGGYGTRGTSGTKVGCGESGKGGDTYGDSAGTVLYRGSGGGSGFPWKVGAGGAGGAGGGVAHISAKRIINYGSIESNGAAGSDGGFFSGAGGGGSGGTISLIGDNLANYGTILAVGGKGGVRAKGSGSGGDFGVKGGDGGYGRIKFDFLTTQSHGIVKPRPTNITTYLGDVLLYKRNSTTLEWSLKTFIPRISEFQFIGHSVALHGNLLAVASTQGTPVSPLEQVFLIDVSTIENDTSPFTYSVLNAPNPAVDRLFGYNMILQKSIFVVSAKGTAETRGVVYIYQDRDLLRHIHSVHPTVLRSRQPLPGDFFGNTITMDFPQLYVQLPLSQDESLPANLRRSAGCVPLYKFVRNISASSSYVTCDYTVVTANVTLNCTVHTFAKDNRAAGDLADIQFITPAVDFQSVGVYTFQVTLSAVGLVPIVVTYHHVSLASVVINVTDAVVPTLSLLTCEAPSYDAGEQVSCHIATNPGSGEEIAAKEFDVYVFDIEDPTASIDGYNSIVNGIVYRSPPSGFVVTNPLATDYYTLRPHVQYVSQGHYRTNFTTWGPGTFAVFALYKNTPLKFPNPVLLDVTLPAVNTTTSYVMCPAVATPNRTLVCMLHLLNSKGVPTDIPTFEHQLVLTNTTKAAYQGSIAALYAVGAVNSDEGRYSVLVKPDKAGFFFVNVTIGSATLRMIPTIGVNISAVHPVQCREYPRLPNSFAIFNQATQARADVSLYGSSATDAAYSNGVGFCDHHKV